MLGSSPWLPHLVRLGGVGWLLEDEQVQARQEALGDTGLQGGHKDRSGPPPAHGAGDLLPAAAGLLCRDRRVRRGKSVCGGWAAPHHPPRQRCYWTLTRPREAALIVHAPAQGAGPLGGSRTAAERQAGLAVTQETAQAQAAGSRTLQRRDTWQSPPTGA